MSRHAGALYLDNRPITEDQVASLFGQGTSGSDGVPGSWSTPGVFLGHADPRDDKGEAQPYVTARGTITFDGRLDNREDLRLLLHDDLGDATGDAVLALAAYQRHGVNGLRSLIGDWSLAIFDAEREQLVLASDFAGVKPLYYYSEANSLVWSTQLKALVDWLRPSEIDDQYVAGFLMHAGYPDLTPYPGIYSLRPGHYLLRSRDRTEIGPFWKPPVDNTIRYRSETDYEESLREVFRDAVRSRLRTGATVICELSGGLDSSSIVCMVKCLVEFASIDPMRFITLSYERRGSLDKRFCSAVERWVGFENIHLSTDGKFLSQAYGGGTLPAFWNELNEDVAAVTRNIGAQTLMTGSLGDLIMGNRGDDSTQVTGLLRAGHIRTALRQSLAWSRALREPIWGVLWRSVLSLLPASMVASRTELFSIEPNLGGRNEDSIAPAFKARNVTAETPSLFSRTWMEAPPERRKVIRGLMQTIELRRLQPPESLAHLDYTHPYAHRPLVEYMLSIPPEIVCRAGEPRWLMRRAFHNFWPPELRARRSKDVFDSAFLAALRRLVPTLMTNVRQLQVVQRGYIDPASLMHRLGRLAQSLECNAAQLRRVILLELWLRRHAGLRLA